MTDLLTVTDFTFAYPDQPATLKHVDLSLPHSQITLLFGQSGSGKTTLLRQLDPALRPTGTHTGTVTWSPDVTVRPHQLQVGFVQQHPDTQIVTDKVWHELAFGLENLGVPQDEIRVRTAEMAAYFGIHQWFHRDVSTLSGGQKQLLNLASVMVLRPALLILDEPTAQLDPIAADDFIHTLVKLNQDLGTTILIAEHRLDAVLPLADQVALMTRGEITVAGSASKVVQALYADHHALTAELPAPTRVYAATTGLRRADNLPLTIKTGQQWLANQSLPVASHFAPPAEPAGKPLIRARDLWFRYDQDGPDVLRGVNLDVYGGETLAIVGGNGSGKSTLLSLLGRIYQPYRGHINLAGKRLARYADAELYHHNLGILPQDPQSLFVRSTVREDLYEVIDGHRQRTTPAYDLEMSKDAAVSGMADLTGLTDLLDRHPYDLSGGEQQRLALAKVLLLRPRVLLLDEPTKGLDAVNKGQLGDILTQLHQEGVTIVLVTHDLTFVAEHADRVGLFFDGQLATVQPTRRFFAGNSFYTTAANRLVHSWCPDAITVREVSTWLHAIRS